MVPCKEEFEKLIEACTTDRLSTAIRLISGNESSSILKGLLEGFDKTLFHTANDLSKLTAYKWLTNQRPYGIAEEKLFKPRPEDWTERKVEWILRKAQQLKVHGPGFADNDRAALRYCLKRVAQSMQLQNRWIAAIASCLKDYHNPRMIPVDNLLKTIKSALIELEKGIKALEVLDEHSEYLVQFPFPSPKPKAWLDEVSYWLEHRNDKSIYAIQRVDATFRERLFVIKMAEQHESLFRRRDGIPGVISDLLYLEGFSSFIDERNVREICRKHWERRDELDVLKGRAGTYARYMRDMR